MIAAINNLLKMEPILCERNFSLTFDQVPGPKGGFRQEKIFIIDRDGFTLLAMGFTGPKALKWKLKYIAAFNAMEAALFGNKASLDKRFLPISLEPSVLNANVGAVSELRRIRGRRDADRLWRLLPLPQIEPSGRERFLEDPVEAEDDSEGALRHLLQQAAGNGTTLGSFIRMAFSDEIAARSLEKSGIKVVQDKNRPRFAVSEKHEVLEKIFAETPWSADWATALNGLDRSLIRLTRIGGKQVRAVHIPKAVLP